MVICTQVTPHPISIWLPHAFEPAEIKTLESPKAYDTGWEMFAPWTIICPTEYLEKLGAYLPKVCAIIRLLLVFEFLFDALAPLGIQELWLQKSAMGCDMVIRVLHRYLKEVGSQEYQQPRAHIRKMFKSS